MNRRLILTLSMFSSLAVMAAESAPVQAGLDPAVDARVKADFETIRQADASRKTAFLTWGTPQADRYRILQQFRDTRVKAALDAVNALVPVRASTPKDQWKAIVSQLAEQPAPPLIAEKALKELPAVVPDEARRMPAEKALKDLASAAKNDEGYRRDGRKKFFALLDKETSTLEDFVSALEKWNDKQAKLDDKLVAASDALRQALTESEWKELVGRLPK